MAASASPPWWAPTCCAARSRRRSPTACWRTPTRPTTRTHPPPPIPAARWCRPHAPSPSHPGCAVVPAALAVGEALGIDGRHFLRAVALGYDVGPRVTMCLGVPALSRDAHLSSHSIAGVFGAAAAAGCAAALDA